MESCSATLRQMGMLDGSQREGFLAGQTFISYFQVESILLDYPRVLEAGVIALCDSTQSPTLRIYLSLEDALESDEERGVFCGEIVDFLRREFTLGCPLQVQVREKLPMTRSGKILRTVLQEWN